MEDACLTLLEAKKKETEDLLFERWVIGHYDYEQSFEEFKKQFEIKRKRSTKSIMKEVNGYIEQFNQGFKKVDINGNI